jgi:PAS domain S-box-containing protein
MTLDAAALRLAVLVEFSDDAIVGTTLDGVIESWNAGARRLLGYTAEEAIGRPIRMVVPDDRHESEAELLERVRRGERIEHYDTVHVRKDGSHVTVSLGVSPVRTPEGKIIGAARIARDITERSLIEREARRLAAIVESSDDAIVAKDLNGIITSWNRSAETMFGYTADEAIGRSITMILPAERLAEEDYVLGQIRSGNRVDHFETIRRRKDGTFIDVSLSVSPILDKSGLVIGASKIARDISVQKRLVRELAETNRLKDEFLALLSHELRTPLNAIMGYTQMLQSDRIAEKGRARALELIDRNAHALARLVSDVFDVSTIVAGKARLKLAVCDLRQVMAAAIEVVGLALRGKRLTLVQEIDAEPIVVFADADRLQQVFWNLLANAVKFTPDEGRVIVRMAKETGRVRVSVSDSGIGIAPEFLPYLFQRFRQADSGVSREAGGLGLGLALVRHFVELHGGTVRASSDGPGKGATFELTLPLHVPD